MSMKESSSSTALAFPSVDSEVENEYQSTKLGFTHDFITTLVSSRAKVDAFCASTKAQADAACEAHAELISERQDKIQSLRERLDEVQTLRGIGGALGGDENANPNNGIAGKRAAMRDREAHIKKVMEDTKKHDAAIKMDLENMSSEESIYRGRAEDVRKAKLEAEEMKKTSVEDLTLGVLNYSKIGINIEGRDQCTRIAFTQVDRSDPERPFEIYLSTNIKNEYVVVQCNPPVDEERVTSLLEQLNKSNDLAYFVRHIRKLFQNTIETLAGVDTINAR